MRLDVCRHALLACWLLGCSSTSTPSVRGMSRADHEPSGPRIVVSGLHDAWSLSHGPDDKLWVGERAGNIVRVDPRTGARRVAVSIGEVLSTSGQDGLLGVALHPRLLSEREQDFVYVAYSYAVQTGVESDRRVKLVRYQYDAASEQLSAPRTLLEGLPASTDHNSGRLRYGPDDRLYYSIGDQGSNHFGHRCVANRAQDLPSAAEIARHDFQTYQGKILRIALDGSVPADNPVLDGVRSHVYSYGHRNVQGLAFAADGQLYASEHGPKTDDELNLIVAGKNYGWPRVAGYRDDKAYVYENWTAVAGCAQLPWDDFEAPHVVPRSLESDFRHPDFTPPIATLYTVSEGPRPNVRGCEGNVCWPTIAPSSLVIHGTRESDGLTFLIPSLKLGGVFRLHLRAGESTLELAPAPLFKTTNRYRDLTLSADGATLYVLTDSESATSGPTTGAEQQLDNRGAILAFPYQTLPQAHGPTTLPP